jgi:hypothetical protein
MTHSVAQRAQLKPLAHAMKFLMTSRCMKTFPAVVDACAGTRNCFDLTRLVCHTQRGSSKTDSQVYNRLIDCFLVVFVHPRPTFTVGAWCELDVDQLSCVGP